MASFCKASSYFSGESPQGVTSIEDVVHGSIDLPEPLRQITDTKPMQRLRSIKQLGPANLVYPCGGHSRFEHSLGVAHIASKMMAAIEANSPDVHLTPDERMCVPIAGLMHDIGHGPYSHLYDGRYMPTAQPGIQFKHEAMSAQIITEKYQENEELKAKIGSYFEDWNWSWCFIKELITGEPHGAKTNEHRQWVGRQEARFLNDIISDKYAGQDVDRMDYLLRDSKMCHVGSSGFDYASLERLIKHACVVPVGNQLRIATAYKVMRTLTMDSARCKLFEVVYHHKTVCVVELMIVETLLMAEKADSDEFCFYDEKGNKYRLSECVNNVDAYLTLRDSILDKIRDSRDPKLAAARAHLSRFDERRLYKHQGEADIPASCVLYDMTEHQLSDLLFAGSYVTPEQRARLRVVAANINHGMGADNPTAKSVVYLKRKGVRAGRMVPVVCLRDIDRPRTNCPHEFALKRLFVFADTDGLDDDALDALQSVVDDSLARLHNSNRDVILNPATVVPCGSSEEDDKIVRSPVTTKRHSAPHTGNQPNLKKGNEEEIPLSYRLKKAVKRKL